MCELFALSSKLPTLASFSLEEFSRHGGNTGPHRDGWGLAFYEDGYAQVFREAQSASNSKWMQFLKEHQHRSQCLISHIRLATQGEPALRNTQPFSREIGGCRHVFCHNGDVSGIFEAMQPSRFKPIGETDSEVSQDLTLFASVPLSEEEWQPLPPNHLVVAKLGVIVSPETPP